MKASRCLVLAALLLAAAGAQSQSGVERPSPGAWADHVFRWSYNGASHPSWLSDEAARQLVVEAAAKWEVCGVRVEFLGETTLTPGVMDGNNVVGWATDLPRQLRGVTSGRGAPGRLIERDIVFSGQRREFELYPELLKKVLVHEFGHAIGLTHSARCDDVMTLASDCPRADPRDLPLVPTPHDIERCRALYALPGPNPR